MPSDQIQPTARGTPQGLGSAASHALVIENRDGVKQVLPFSSDEIVLGRGGQGNTVRLLERDISRRHARFSRSSGAVWIEDLGSSNGTRVNGERLEGKRRIREGDLVQIGGYDIAVVGAAELARGSEAGRPAPLEARPPPAAVAVPGPVALPSKNGSAHPERRIREADPKSTSYASVLGSVPKSRAGQARALLAIGTVSLLLGWATGRLLHAAPHPEAAAADKVTGR